MNKRYIILALSLIVILALIGGTAAFFSTTGIAKSEITTSNLNIELLVLEKDGDGEKPVSASVTLMPGESKSRIVHVKNSGNEPAWIRVKAGVTVRSDAMPAAGAAENQDFYVTDLNDRDWVYSEGYWYYRTVLNPGETSEMLFSQVTLDGGIGNDKAGTEVSFDISAEGTQSKNNGDSWADAQGWPEA